MAEIITFASDLIFTSKISAAAKAVGLSAATARSLAALEAALGEEVRVAFVDMSMPTELAVKAIESCREKANTIAFYSHVQIDQRKAAEAAGVHRILPRSQFVIELNDILKEAARRE